ncbi:hypothetical protein GCM10010121_030030 [Streptomyces brasiliensis]|uniref:Uncharacterized protein n=1 Tax=Streptomyces brasiliensis TaxID=1954 RepID=A0A917KL98_9ACTN|nr:hypothetical protein GCM10010121_030030 [Streptomyces brasiliensis]
MASATGSHRARRKAPPYTEGAPDPPCAAGDINDPRNSAGTRHRFILIADAGATHPLDIK